MSEAQLLQPGSTGSDMVLGEMREEAEVCLSEGLFRQILKFPQLLPDTACRWQEWLEVWSHAPFQ